MEGEETTGDKGRKSEKRVVGKERKREEKDREKKVEGRRNYKKGRKMERVESEGRTNCGKG